MRPDYERERKPWFEAWDGLKNYNNIGIDIDGVLVDFVSIYLKVMNERFGTDYTPDQVTDWKFEKSLGISKEMTAMVWDSRELMAEMAYAQPYKSGIELCRLLVDMGKRVHYVTARGTSEVDSSRDQGLQRLTEKWLMDNDFPLGSVSFWNDKREVAQHWGIKGFVEDSPRNALQLAEYGLGVVLIDAPYNQGVEHEMIKRVEGWV